MSRLPWWFAGTAAVLVLVGTKILYDAERWNANTPHTEVAFFGALAAIPLALTGLVVELAQAERGSPRVPKRRRAWFWAFTALVALAALYVGGIALLAGTFPTC